ncbi:diacylglycerol/lipid kinase family protein [Bailinhaonella thermotolerans]|uniref:Diacylglycerol kinase family lipid kinase n=1 Tax=Bailinhaonella thermotolerans TaxID=1070861 RepID=A0A3A4AHB8_9ACTN|nr:diacylglycerol kinase family protein [Bailinhaonella thermotolerans]RJL25230.1 diacylglycerol kinase family lipid kinase [Bailinhaonella thermotolerans]
MRALLLVNPKATTTNQRTRDVLIRALGAAVRLDVTETRYRGHAAKLAREAARDGRYDVVAVLGGDGTINEAVNGLLEDGPSPDRPALAMIPGGSANVFARALGIPGNPVEATGVALEALRSGSRRTVGLGRAAWSEAGEHTERYFTFCAGVGYDAEVVRAVEGLRGAGYRATPGLYVSTALRHYLMTDRRRAALTLTRPGHPGESGIFMAIVTNTAPWTYLGSRPVNPTPLSAFDAGLDLLGLSRLGLPSILNVVRQIVGERSTPLRGRRLVQVHDASELALSSSRPIAFQLDGEYLGEAEKVTFYSIPDALQVLV